MKTVRLLIIEDRPLRRERLRTVLARQGALEVVAALASLEEALRFLGRAAVDVITLRWGLPGAAQAVRHLTALHPLPVVALVDGDLAEAEAVALRQGAVSVHPALGSEEPADSPAARALGRHLEAMSQVRVIRRRLKNGLGPIPGAPPYKVLALTSSTGGPAALRRILGDLAPDFPLPILIVQHISKEFAESFVPWLADSCRFAIQLAQPTQVVRPGHVYLAPPGQHLAWDGHAMRLSECDPVSYQCPSGTVLFRSLAHSLGPAAIGVLLTGIGDDGAEGLLEMRRAGAYTIAQDRESSVVYGMPAAAAALGAALEILSLPEIGPRLNELVAAQKETRR